MELHVGNAGASSSVNCVVSDLGQVIAKKDEEILELRNQLALYRAHFGELPPEALTKATTCGGTANPTSMRNSTPRPSIQKQNAQSPLRDCSSDAVAQADTDNSSSSSSNNNKVHVVPSSSLSTCTRTGHYVVVDFVEDSPMFRRQLEGFEDSVSGLRGLFKEILAHTKEYITSGMRFGQEEMALAEEIANRKYSRALFTTSSSHNLKVPAMAQAQSNPATATTTTTTTSTTTNSSSSTKATAMAQLSVSAIFNEFHDVVAQIMNSRVTLLLSVDALLNQTIAGFMEKEFKETSDLRKEVVRLGEEYESQLGKLLSKAKQTVANAGVVSSSSSSSLTSLGGTPIASTTGDLPVALQPNAMSSATSTGHGNVNGNGSSNNLVSLHNGTTTTTTTTTTNTCTNGILLAPAAERDVAQCRLRFELARFDLVRYLNRLESQKTFVLIECFNSTLCALLSHYHACYELIRNVETMIQQRQETLQLARKQFDEDEQMWIFQREQLEKKLSIDLQDKMTISTSCYRNNPMESLTIQHPSNGMHPALLQQANSSYTISSSGNGCGTTRAIELPVEIISKDTLTSRLATSPGQLTIVKQGYLFVRNSMFPSRNWKRRWFQIHSGKLFQGKGKHLDFLLVCDLLLAKVRESPTCNLPFCFEVIDSTQSKLLLQATSESEMTDWIEAARKSTESMLEKQSHRQNVHPQQESCIQEITWKNPCCGDCGQSPAEWVSINLGVLLCIECSGIHRSLGVHVSKIRSLTLDSWDISLLTLLRDELGNEIVNGIFESPSGMTSAAVAAAAGRGGGGGGGGGGGFDSKPTASSSREDKARWIQAKYLSKIFVESPLEPNQDLQTRFFMAAEAGSTRDLLWAVAHGVDVNTLNDRRETALHVCASRGHASCCEFLVLNGALLNLADARGRFAYDAAKANGFEEIKLSLMQRMSLEQYQF